MLSLNAIDHLFARMLAVYGRDFMGRHEGQDINTVKSTWSYTLEGFGDHLAAIAWALENLPERAPNVIEFRNLCRKAPTTDTPRLEAPKADPVRMRGELAKLHTIVEPTRKPAYVDDRAWARRLIDRHVSGAYRSTPAALKMACAALGVEYPPK